MFLIYNMIHLYVKGGSSMTHLEVEAFLAVVRTGSITRAAESLFITQPALSRRLKTLEAELGYSLVVRKNGVRRAEPTPEGRAFAAVAEKWSLLWEEAMSIPALEHRSALGVSAVDSVSTYILAGVYRAFLEENPAVSLSIRTFHANEAYGYVQSGLVDVAFVSDDIYAADVVMTPAFREPMLLVCSEQLRLPKVVRPSGLDPSKQIRIPWNLEYDRWHRQWFGEGAAPRVLLDKMSWLEEFLSWEDNWAILPASVAYRVQEKAGNLAIREMRDGPADRVIYYLLGRHSRQRAAEAFLACVRARVSGMRGVTLLL